MKLLLGILIALVVVSTSVAVYSEIQRRDDAKRIAKLESKVALQRKAIDSIDETVGSSDELGGGGFWEDGLASRVDSLCTAVTSANC